MLDNECKALCRNGLELQSSPAVVAHRGFFEGTTTNERGVTNENLDRLQGTQATPEFRVGSASLRRGTQDQGQTASRLLPAAEPPRQTQFAVVLGESRQGHFPLLRLRSEGQPLGV